MPKRSARRLSIAFASVLAVAAALAPSAQAGLLVESAGDCDEQSASQVFLPWLDVANYVLAPGGAAESADGWTLTGGAGVAPGNEPWNVHGAGDSSSLSLPSGSSATTGAMCVGIEHPTLRFFAKSSGAGPLSALKVEVLFEDSLGLVDSLTIGYAGPSGSWTPTAPYVVGASLLPLLPGSHTPVAFRFTPQGTGSWRIDDVYVDPYGRH